MPIFSESLSVVKAVEARLIVEQESEIAFIAYLQRLIWFPLKFLKLGVAERVKGASLWAFLSFAFLIIGAWIISNTGVARTELANIITLGSMLVPMFLVVFAMPSMYGSSGVPPGAVKFVVQHLRSRGFANSGQIELLKKSIKPFEDRARARVTVLKWLSGLLWAGFLYILSKGVEASPASATQVLSHFMTAAWLLICVLGAYLIVWGYEASLDTLFRTIEFGCNDCCELVENNGAPFFAADAC